MIDFWPFSLEKTSKNRPTHKQGFAPRKRRLERLRPQGPVCDDFRGHRPQPPDPPTLPQGGEARGPLIIYGQGPRPPPPVEGWGGRGAGADDPENRHKEALQASIAQASVCEGRNPACE